MVITMPAFGRVVTDEDGNKSVDTSHLSTIKMVAGAEKEISRVILNSRVHNWVGIGWVAEGPATTYDKKRYPAVSQ